MVDVPADQRVHASLPKYVPTTSAARYLPRRNAYRWDGAAWVNGGVLLETVAATNLDPNSDDLSAWTTSNTTIAKTQTGADGVANSAHLITSTAANGTALEQITASSADHAWGCLMKRVTGTGTVEVTVDGGTTWVDITSDINTSEYVQVSTGAGITVTNPEFGVRLVTSGDAVSVQVSQLEQTSAFVSAPIPTNGATATRVAESGLDVDNADVTIGTDTSMHVQGRVTIASWNNERILEILGAGANRILMFPTTGNASYYVQNTTEVLTVRAEAGALPTGYDQALNVAGRIDAGAAGQCAIDGVAGTADTTDIPTIPALTGALKIFSGGGSEDVNGFVEMVRVWDADIATAGIESATT